MNAILKSMKQKKKATAQQRSWGLILISSLIIISGLTLVALSVIYIGTFGWWSLLIGVSGLSSICLATMSIVKNDPSWILLDIIT